MKNLGYEWSTHAGLTISIADVTTPPAKAGLLEKFEGEAAKVESQYDAASSPTTSGASRK